MPVRDPQVDLVRRPFDDAFRRMCAAPTPAQLEDELSNLLHQLYRLGELCKKRLAGSNFKQLQQILCGSNDLRAARAALWVRSFDTHDVVVVASMSGLYSDFYTEMNGVLAWAPLVSLPEQTDKYGYGRHLDYEHILQDKPVLDTIRRAFDAMAALL